jgi:hypothetical protein
MPRVLGVSGAATSNIVASKPSNSVAVESRAKRKIK